MQDTQEKEAQDQEADTGAFEIIEQDQHKVRHKGVYLLPNLFTTAALFAGFYAIVAAMNGKFVDAAVAILIAGVLDGMDGGVARMTNTQSKFGAEYDSLSDCVAFGVAPGLVAYAYGLQGLGRWGWAAAFIYVACAALRLARFNVQHDTADKRFFTGLPSPSAAGLVATLVWYGASSDVMGSNISWLVALVTAGAGLLMMSNVKYHSFKEFHVGRVPFRVLVGVIVVFAIIFIDPPKVLLTVAIVYTLSGLALGLLDWRRRIRN